MRKLSLAPPERRIVSQAAPPVQQKVTDMQLPNGYPDA